MGKSEDANSKVAVLSAEKQEALFQSLLGKIQAASDPHKLEECTLLALSLMLRRPGDKDLLNALRKQVVYAMDELPKGRNGKFIASDIRPVAKRCVGILRVAKEKRLSRAEQEAQGLCDPHDHGGRPKAKGGASRKGTYWGLAGLFLVLIAGGAVWKFLSGGEDDEPTPSRLVEQIIEASQGKRVRTHVYGGPMYFDGATVTAAQLPPKVCASAGWTLVRKGILTINDTTPNRVSAAIISGLCNENETASISWSPKPKE